MATPSLTRVGWCGFVCFRLRDTGDQLPPGEVEEMINMCDTDGDGTIEYENFVTMVQNAPQNLGLLDL